MIVEVGESQPRAPIMYNLFTQAKDTHLLVLITLHLKWNVTPLLGDFGGRVEIYRFLQSPRRLPSLFICRDLFSFCHFNSVLAGPGDCNECRHMGEVQKKRTTLKN